MSNSMAIATAIVLTVAAAVLNSTAMGPAVILLNIGLVAALIAWLTCGSWGRDPHRLVGPVFLVSIVIQTLHFVEEYRGRLYETLPPQFGLEALQPHRFVIFNLIWIAIFVAAAIGVFKGIRLSLLVVWFMALLGGIGNAILHGWLAIRSGGYVPGVLTALLNLPLGVTLVVLLVASTGRE